MIKQRVIYRGIVGADQRPGVQGPHHPGRGDAGDQEAAGGDGEGK